jgi:hypothetical protein
VKPDAEAYATGVITTEVECARCGRPAPAETKELAAWRHGELALEGVVDEGLLLWPDCDAEDREHAYEEGEGG